MQFRQKDGKMTKLHLIYRSACCIVYVQLRQLLEKVTKLQKPKAERR
jgi:hypothetical protein